MNHLSEINVCPYFDKALVEVKGGPYFAPGSNGWKAYAVARNWDDVEELLDALTLHAFGVETDVTKRAGWTPYRWNGRPAT